MLVSVVVVSHNSGALLVECVQRALASDHPVELIVSDNASDDGSVVALHQLANTEPRLRVIENGRNLGFAAANNRALALATGEWVLFLNPDCLVEPDTVSRMTAVLQQCPNAGMAGCRIRNADGSVDPACSRQIPTPTRLLRQWLGQPSPDAPLTAPEAISGAFMLVRRSDLEAIGSFDTRYFMHWEDLDLCRRFRQAGREILYVPDVEVLHVRGHSSRPYPLRVEWYKHVGMLRFLHQHHFCGWRALALLALAPVVVARYLVRVLRQPSTASVSPPLRLPGDRRPQVWVFGATSLVGRTLLPRLVAAGYAVRAFTSGDLVELPASPHLVWQRLDLSRAGELPPGRPDTLIHLAPLPLLPAWLEALSAVGVGRVLAFGSTSRFTKLASPAAAERQLAASLAGAEALVMQTCERLGLPWVLLLPTMIYSLGHDGNITKLDRLIRRFGVLLLPGQGKGLRQPVHADDLARACLQLLGRPEAWNRRYELSGGQTLSYRRMLEALFQRRGLSPRVYPVPAVIWRPLLALLRLWPAYREFNAAMAARVDIDMCFDHDQATCAFGYAPRAFEP